MYELEVQDIDAFFWSAELLIADFGEIRTAPLRKPAQMGKQARMRSNFQPPWYRAPEVYLGDWPLTCAVDMWSFASIMWTLFTGDSIFYDVLNVQVFPLQVKNFCLCSSKITKGEGAAPATPK